MAEPVRTCVGCRRRLPQADLRRFVQGAQGYEPDDPRRRGPGRGAYLCSAACIERVRKNKRYPGLAAAAASLISEAEGGLHLAGLTRAVYDGAVHSEQIT